MQIRDPEAGTKKPALRLEAVQLHQLGLNWFNFSAFGSELLYATLHWVSKYGSVLWYWTPLQKHTWIVIRKVPLDDAMHMYNHTHSWLALKAPSNCHFVDAKDFICWTALPLMSSPTVFYLSAPCEVRQQYQRSHHFLPKQPEHLWDLSSATYSAQCTERIICNLHHFLSLCTSQNDVFSSNMGESQASCVYKFSSP